jgi:hypothetical protein
MNSNNAGRNVRNAKSFGAKKKLGDVDVDVDLIDVESDSESSRGNNKGNKKKKRKKKKKNEKEEVEEDEEDVGILKKIPDKKLLLSEDKKNICFDDVEKDNNLESFTKLEEEGDDNGKVVINGDNKYLKSTGFVRKVKSEHYLNKKTDSRLRCTLSESEIIKSPEKLLSSTSCIFDVKNNGFDLLFISNNKKLKPTIGEEIINENPSCLNLLGLIETNRSLTERRTKRFFGQKKRKIKKKKVFKICEINGKKEIKELEVNDMRVNRRKIK